MLKSLNDMLKSFCLEHEKYNYEADYCGTAEGTDSCAGISLSNDDSYMGMLAELTEYLDSQSFEDENMELLNPEIDELEDRMVVYFPNIMR